MKQKRTISACPVCDAALHVTELTCSVCATRLAGEFDAPPLARLAPEHQMFVETFVRCRGVIRDVEKALGISYPTVRARLDAAVDALEAVFAEEKAGSSAATDRRHALLKRVEAGDLSPEEAAKRLRRL